MSAAGCCGKCFITTLMFTCVLVCLTVYRSDDGFPETSFEQTDGFIAENVTEDAMSSTKILRVEYEVFGRVQGVFFRKYTQKESERLGLKGWCMNTSDGTVRGIMEGPADKVAKMKNWLMETGSPQSKIDRAEFKVEEEITNFSYGEFSIKR